MIKAIIFDADGIVIDTEPLYAKGDRDFFTSLGVIHNTDDYRHYLTGKSLQDGTAKLQEMYGFPGTPAELYEKRLACVKKYYKDVQFVPGFQKFFTVIKDKYKTAVATASNVDLFAIADSGLHLTEMFNGHVYYLKDVGNLSKPAPDIFLHAAKMLGVKPEECVVLEDAVNGVQAAKSAGMRCIALTTTHSRSMLNKADLIVDSYKEINLLSPIFSN